MGGRSGTNRDITGTHLRNAFYAVPRDADSSSHPSCCAAFIGMSHLTITARDAVTQGPHAVFPDITVLLYSLL